MKKQSSRELEFYEFRENLAFKEVPKIERLLREFFGSEIMKKVSITTMAQMLEERELNDEMELIINYRQSFYGIFTGAFNWGGEEIGILADAFIGKPEMAIARVWNHFENFAYNISHKNLLQEFFAKYPISRITVKWFIFYHFSKWGKTYGNLVDFFLKESKESVLPLHFLEGKRKMFIKKKLLLMITRKLLRKF